ncbi:MAG TPA: hypothetical protein P5137_12115 [Candidatus Brocadiia bacterium]|nr:hypothetical protein [Candidatus Brocadiia bacterium]
MADLVAGIDELLAPLPEWLGQFRDDRGRYRYHRASGPAYCLYATLEGLSLADMLGGAPVAEEQRQSALRFLKDCQSPEDGYFRCPACSAAAQGAVCSESNKDGITFKVAATLMMAGVKPAYPLPDGDMLFCDVGAGLERIFLQNNPYGAGSQVWKKSGMHGLKVLSERRDPNEDSYQRRVMDWLLRHQDPETGLWFPKGDRLNGMNGLLKMRYGTFDLCGVEIPNPERIVATILAIPSPTTGRFGESCDDWNGVGLLAELGRRAPAFRQEILEVYRRILPAMRAKRDMRNGGFTWGQGGESYLKPTFINAVGLLAMKAFVVGDDATIDNIFFLRILRRKMLGAGL